MTRDDGTTGTVGKRCTDDLTRKVSRLGYHGRTKFGQTLKSNENRRSTVIRMSGTWYTRDCRVVDGGGRSVSPEEVGTVVDREDDTPDVSTSGRRTVYEERS